MMAAMPRAAGSGADKRRSRWVAVHAEYDRWVVRRLVDMLLL